MVIRTFHCYYILFQIFKQEVKTETSHQFCFIGIINFMMLALGSYFDCMLR